jgi:hypothetical protein
VLGVDVHLRRLAGSECLHQHELMWMSTLWDHSKNRLPSSFRVAWVKSSVSASHSSLRSGRMVRLTTMEIMVAFSGCGGARWRRRDREITRCHITSRGGSVSAP